MGEFPTHIERKRVISCPAGASGPLKTTGKDRREMRGNTVSGRKLASRERSAWRMPKHTPGHTHTHTHNTEVLIIE